MTVYAVGFLVERKFKVLMEVQNMVKVIKYGPKRRVTCDVCGALLEFEKNDISTVQTGINELERYIRCPVCGEGVVIKDKI